MNEPKAICHDLVQFFDEWELTLPVDAREALRPVVERARKEVQRDPQG